jgi:gas vesicle protein
MDNQAREQKSNGMHPVDFLAGLFIGGLAGAVTMLLIAPQSGRETRESIKKGAIELRNQTTASMEGAVVQVRTKASQVEADVKDKAMDLKHQGQDMLVEQLDRVSAAAAAGKKAVQGTHN